jgi:hypothetical protein
VQSCCGAGRLPADARDGASEEVQEVDGTVGRDFDVGDATGGVLEDLDRRGRGASHELLCIDYVEERLVEAADEQIA